VDALRKTGSNGRSKKGKMPYIKQEDRARFAPILARLDDTPIGSAGELNFLITSVVHHYLLQFPKSYGIYNNAIGALEAAKLELYRRQVAPYEDTKIQENGDL
jgi:hypothetical protein